MTSSKGKIEFVTDAGLPVGVAMAKDAEGKIVLGFDPGFSLPKTKPATTLLERKKAKDKKAMEKQAQYYSIYSNSNLVPGPQFETFNSWGTTIGRYADWGQHRLDSFWGHTKDQLLRYYLQWPRGYGKNTMFQGFNDLASEAEKAAKGIQEFTDAIAEAERKERERREQARLAIPDEKVYPFMEANYLPYDYARRLLEDAYLDALQPTKDKK